MPAQLLVGTAGWSYRDWDGNFYPQKKPRGFDLLAYYAQFFDIVEIDSSFYRPPTAATSHAWLIKVSANPRFVFAAKLWQRFTHPVAANLIRGAAQDPSDKKTAAAKFRGYSDTDIALFKRGIEPLLESGKLVALLWQFPWSFRFETRNLDLLTRLAKDFAGWPNFVEVRHKSWNQPKALEPLRQLCLGFVNIDQPQLRDCLPPTDIALGKRGYFRLHGRNTENWFAPPEVRRQGFGGELSRTESGVRSSQSSALSPQPLTHRYDYLYTDSELRALLPKIRAIALATKELVVIFNNHNVGQAPANALQFLALAAGPKPVAPSPLVTAFPNLAKICATRSVKGSSQAELF